MTQKDVFRDSEGDQFYQRNKEKLDSLEVMMDHDRVVSSLKQLPIGVESILEIGCSNGWRLEALRRVYGATCRGIDPSSEAVHDGTALFPAISLQTGTAEKLPYADKSFDLVIFGFCLYLCDRGDLFRIVAETDRVLREKSYVAVLDFHPPFAYRNEYKHKPGIFAYKMDYSTAFLWNPEYSLMSQVVFAHQGQVDSDNPDERIGVTILRKNNKHAYPDKPYV